MPLLVKKWLQFNDKDKKILPLIECLEVVIRKIGQASEPFVEPIFTKCCTILRQLDQIDSGWQDDFMNYCFSLISVICKAISKQTSQNLINQNELLTIMATLLENYKGR